MLMRNWLVSKYFNALLFQYLEVILGAYLRVVLGGAGCRGWGCGAGDKSVGQVCRAVLHDLLHSGASFKEVRRGCLFMCVCVLPCFPLYIYPIPLPYCSIIFLLLIFFWLWFFLLPVLCFLWFVIVFIFFIDFTFASSPDLFSPHFTLLILLSHTSAFLFLSCIL